MMLFSMGLVVYVFGFVLSYSLFPDLQPQFASVKDKLWSCVKVLFMSIFWFIFIPILMFGLFNFKK